MAGHGDAFKRGFQVLLQQLGNVVTITRSWSTTSPIAHEARGLKTAREEDATAVYFAFPEGTDVQVGDVLQIRPGRDLWRVHDVEDHVSGGVLVNTKAWVDKISPDGKSLTASGAPTAVFHGPVIGGVQVGGSANTQTVTVSISEVTKTLDHLKSAIDTSDLGSIEKEEALAEVDRISALSTRSLADVEPALRRRVDRLRSIVGVGTSATKGILPLVTQLALLLKLT